MELDREGLADQAFEENVDLQRSHRELIEAIFFQLHAMRTPEGWLLPDEAKPRLAKIRVAKYDDLADGKWKQLAGLPTHAPTPVDNIEALIKLRGPRCRLYEKKDLQLLCANARMPLEPFQRLLAETAVNQTLAKTGIGRVEYELVKNNTDLQLIQETKIICELVYRKIKTVLASR